MAAAIAACAGEDAPPPYGGGGAGGAGTTTTTTTGAASVTSSGAGGALPEVFTVTGIVTDGATPPAPIEGAIVMQGGGAPDFVTGPDGLFSIEMSRAVPGVPTLVAAKVGYRSRGVEITALPDGPIELGLRLVTPPDNADYQYGDPGTGDPAHDTSTDFCGHCHLTFAAQFQTSGHARSARGPLLHDLYAGTSRAHADAASCAAAGGVFRAGREPGTPAGAIMKCYLGAGVLPDLNPGCGAAGQPACDDPALPPAARPTAFGACADCHAAGLQGPAGGRDLLDAVGLAYDHGNHCEACHKASDVDLTRPPGTAGALVIQRPRDRESDLPGSKLLQVMYGPYPDVPLEFMGGSYQPVFRTAAFCAACHEQKQPALVPGSSLDPARWPDGLPVHSTYSEWSDGPWGTPGTPCHFCHMPEQPQMTSSIDGTTGENAGIVFGFLRPPGAIRSHEFLGPLAGAPRLIDTALTVALTLAPQGSELGVTVQLRNQGCGHAIPTGEPMRSLVLLVRASACNAPIPPIAGMSVNDVGGALAEAQLGQGAALAGATLTWPEGAARASVGQVVRIVRPTGVYDDYVGIGRFADPTLTPAEKGLEIRAPVGEAAIAAVAGGEITLAAPIAAQDGDRVLLGDALAWPPGDGQPSPALAGAAGSTFARVLVDPAGNRQVPHHRAIDMVSDNRIPPQGDGFSVHTFALPPMCPSATVDIAVLYRPVPLGLARERGHDGRDFVIATASQTVALP